MTVELPPDFDDFQTSVRSDLDEGLGVYEVWWMANTRYPHLPVSSRLYTAERIAGQLIQDPFIRLVHGPWIGSEHDRQPVADPDDALLQWATWVPQKEYVVWLDRVPTT